MSELLDQIDKSRLPQHVAVIMDGNGRWAKKHGRPRVFGHRNGVKAVRATSEIAAELGINYLTLYAFSTENWSRPKPEVNALMSLLVDTLRKEVKTLMKNNIRLAAIGDLNRLPSKSQRSLAEAIAETQGNSRMTLNLALNYSSKWEIMNAVKGMVSDVEAGKLDAESIQEKTMDQYLATAGMPDPELLIRTSGEQRISNYLLWQIAYTELYFTETYWPDFDKDAFCRAIIDYQQRERRFGKISEQINV